MPRTVSAQIRKKLNTLALDPYSQHRNVKRLSGSHQYRLRVGDWRVLYEIENEQLVILVIKVGPRGSVYKK